MVLLRLKPILKIYTYITLARRGQKLINLELYKLLSKKLLWIGLVLVLFISFIMFKMRTPNGELYNYTIVEKLDESGNSYLEHENDFEQPIASTYRERVQAIKKTT